MLVESGTNVAGMGRRTNGVYVFAPSEPYLQQTIAHFLVRVRGCCVFACVRSPSPLWAALAELIEFVDLLLLLQGRRRFDKVLGEAYCAAEQLGHMDILAGRY